MDSVGCTDMRRTQWQVAALNLGLRKMSAPFGVLLVELEKFLLGRFLPGTGYFDDRRLLHGCSRAAALFLRRFVRFYDFHLVVVVILVGGHLNGVIV